ncbi:MAG: polysaccharide deacetylase family protein [Sporomusaceae bacterium]|nr:polysaccharide deacetylase family protein [Sporomusaceae bacterium]
MLTRRQFLKKCAFALAASYGAACLLPARAAAGAAVPVPVYHRVGEGSDDLTIAGGRFADDLRFLADNGYLTLTVGQLKAHLLTGRPLPENAVFLTFDDGYLDNYAAAFPLLVSYGMTASFFVITGRLGQPGRMTASQIMEMSAAGMYIGSHTVSHRPLATLAKWENTLEMQQSKACLEDLLGKEVGVIAYPYGSYNSDTLAAAREAGYWAGFTVRRGWTDTAGDPLAMNRLPVFRNGRRLAAYLN